MQVTCAAYHPRLQAELLYLAHKIGLPIRYEEIYHGVPVGGGFEPAVRLFGHMPDELPQSVVRFVLRGETVELAVSCFPMVLPDPVALPDPDGGECFLGGREGGTGRFFVSLPEVLNALPHRLQPAFFGDVIAPFVEALAARVRSHDYAPEAETLARHRERAAEKILALNRRHLEGIRRDIRSLEDNLREVLEDERETFLSMRLVGEAKTQNAAEIREAAGREIRRVFGMAPGRFAAIRFLDGKFMAETHPVEIEHDGVVYRLGRYEIVADLGKGKLSIDCVARPSHAPLTHPHISERGRPCLGTLETPVQRLLIEGEIVALLEACLRFLHSYSPENAYADIEKWDPAGSGVEEEAEDEDLLADPVEETEEEE